MASESDHRVLKQDGCAGKRRSRLSIGCWNMRTLVEAEGNIETSVVRPSARGVAVDRKATLMVQELKKYRMNITGISETKWFGQAMYNVEGYTILHSGRPVPGDAQRVERNEGVGIVLDPQMTAAWRSAGEEWKAVSSRIVTARVKLEEQRVNKTRQANNNSAVFVTVVSVYAPTHGAPLERKEDFYADLQSTLDSVHVDDVLLLVGDFNARVGSSDRQGGTPTWDGVRGYEGVGKLNESGEVLLSFCALNELTIMNTYFEKKNIYKYTWQHPGSKQWHCIDYVIMRQNQRRLCCDVTVLRSADCWTDHKLLRARLQLKTPTRPAKSKTRRRYDVAALVNDSVREEYNKRIREAIVGEWKKEENGVRKWEIMRDGMMSAAESVLGWENRRQPDWFRDNITVLQQLITKRNKLFNQWLQTHHHSDRQRYVAQRRAVAKEVKRAKNTWFQQKAWEIERGIVKGTSGRGVWQGLREIQRDRAGLQPVKSKAIRNHNGLLCAKESMQCWRNHFEAV